MSTYQRNLATHFCKRLRERYGEYLPVAYCYSLRHRYKRGDYVQLRHADTRGRALVSMNILGRTVPVVWDERRAWPVTVLTWEMVA